MKRHMFEVIIETNEATTEELRTYLAALLFMIDFGSGDTWFPESVSVESKNPLDQEG